MGNLPLYGSGVKIAQLHEITTQCMVVLINISYVCAIILGELGLILKLPRNKSCGYRQRPQ